MSRLIFVDTEDANPDPIMGWTLREFGAVEYKTRATFHGHDSSYETFVAFWEWLKQWWPNERIVFVADNPAYDWAPMHFYLMKHCAQNPFGWSARRIGDFYAGLVGDFNRSSEWKSLRVTPHDHNPVNDAMGNVEAFERMLNGERGRRRKKRWDQSGLRVSGGSDST